MLIYLKVFESWYKNFYDVLLEIAYTFHILFLCEIINTSFILSKSFFHMPLFITSSCEVLEKGPKPVLFYLATWGLANQLFASVLKQVLDLSCYLSAYVLLYKHTFAM